MLRAARLAREGGADPRRLATMGGLPESVSDGLEDAILSAVLTEILPHLLELDARVKGG